MLTASSIVDKLREYLAVPSVVGHERPFLDYLQKDFTALGFTTERVRNLLSVTGSDPAVGAVSVHIDRHGLVATGQAELEYAAFVARAVLYGEDRTTTPAFLAKLSGRFTGETVRAYHRDTGEIMAEGVTEAPYFCPIRKNLVFRVPGFEALPLGTPAAYAMPLAVEDGEIAGQLDNVISAAIAYCLARDGFPGRLLFTAEEEIGRSWQHLRDYLVATGVRRTDMIVLDTSPFDRVNTELLGRVVLRHRDAHAPFNPELVDRLFGIACDLGLEPIFKDQWVIAQKGLPPGDYAGLGSTELGRLVKATDGAWNGATLQVPTHGYHTARETARLDALQRVVAVLEAHYALAQ